MTIALFGNTFQSRHLEAVAGFIGNLLSLDDTTVVAESSFHDYLKGELATRGIDIKAFDTAADFAAADLALSFGGDGTFLSAAGMIGSREIPLLGVNTGHLGYLAATDINDAPIIFESIKRRSYVIERRTMLHVSSPALPRDISPYALNEVAILKANSASMITIDTTLDGSTLATYKADGLLVCTPTGSTAYNLSVGGPIIDPATQVWVISPVAPHTLTMRPLVVNDRSTLRVTPFSRSKTFRLSIDGRSVSLPDGTPLTISRAPFDTLLARLPEVNYLDTLRSKLLWGQ